jgi:hypothetical protein
VNQGTIGGRIASGQAEALGHVRKLDISEPVLAPLALVCAGIVIVCWPMQSYHIREVALFDTALVPITI